MYGLTGLKVKSSKPSNSVHSKPTLSQAQLPESVDWHKEGKVTSPHDQGGCGSCWAFTTAATMESAYAIRFGKQPERMSVQYLVDCDPVNFGCGGGWMLDAYEYTRTHGLIKEGEYSQYQARKTQCANKDDVKDRIKNDD